MERDLKNYYNPNSLTVKSGWPITCQITYGNKSHIIEYTMKDDLRHFNITDRELAFESRKISHQRISNIKKNVGSPASMSELSALTAAFNRIIDQRTKGEKLLLEFEDYDDNL